MSGRTVIAITGGVIVLINVIGLLLLVPRNVPSASREPRPFGDAPLVHDASDEQPDDGRVMRSPTLDGVRPERTTARG